MRHRSEYLDNVKGLLVFLVVLAHFLAETTGLSKAVNAVYIVLYTFHVPLFAFLSGYLSRSRRAREQAPRRFLPSYLFAAFGFSLFSDLVFHAYAHPGQPLGGFLAQGLHYLGKAALSVFLAPGPSWFLLSLISWRLLAPRAEEAAPSLGPAGRSPGGGRGGDRLRPEPFAHRRVFPLLPGGVPFG